MTKLHPLLVAVFGGGFLIVLGLVGWVGIGIERSRLHGLAYQEVVLGGPAVAIGKRFAKQPDCRYLLKGFEIHYYLSPTFRSSTMPNCSPAGSAIRDWKELPGNTYEAAVFTISANGRVEAKELTGEGSMNTLPGSILPEGATTIQCCGAIVGSSR